MRACRVTSQIVNHIIIQIKRNRVMPLVNNYNCNYSGWQLSSNLLRQGKTGLFLPAFQATFSDTNL